jgi:hypothetical protein
MGLGLLWACRAETRSQGIATGPPRWPRPPLSPALQSRDPFSGDCDERPLATRPTKVFPPCRAETRSQGIATINFEQPSAPCSAPLAEPRPVLRGLRHGDVPHGPPPLRERACRAETRSQGIATPGEIPAPSCGSCKACRAETRSQGIATRRSRAREEEKCCILQSRDPFSGDCDGGLGGLPPCHRKKTCRAETRSQGIATPGEIPAPSCGSCKACRAETRSQGIATRRSRAREEEKCCILQSRDPFSGDCDGGLGGLPPCHRKKTCRAETRSQGIATPGEIPAPSCGSCKACRAETRSQGIATAGRPPAGGRRAPPPCRAETRSQGIATAKRTAPRRKT